MTVFLKNILISCLLYLTSVNCLATPTRDYTPNEMLQFKRFGQVVPSPDGKEVVVITFQVQNIKDTMSWEYALYRRDKGGKISLMHTSPHISSAAWSPDGKQIFFLSKGKAFQSLWASDVSTGETKQLYEHTSDIESYKISPSGESIAFISKDPTKTSKSMVIDVEATTSIRALYIIPNHPKDSAVAERLNLNTINIRGFDWAPNSKSLVIGYQPIADDIDTLTNKLGIYELNSQQLKDIPYTITHNSVQPVFSPDGKWIAFQSNLSADEFVKQFDLKNPPNKVQINTLMWAVTKVCVFDTVKSKTHCLAPTFNEEPTILGWDADSQNVYVLEMLKTVGYEIYSLNIDPSKTPVNISNSNGFIEPLTLALNSGHNFFGFAYETVNSRPEAYISPARPFKKEKIELFQASPEKAHGTTEVVQWHAKDGTLIDGLLIKPDGYDSSKKYPLLTTAHGGPASAWAKRYLGGCDEYAEMLDPTTCWGNILSEGFVIFAPNPRGSSGYGSKFRLANYGDFGGAEYLDIMSGIDLLIEKGIVDPAQLAIAGWSHGGYLTARALTQSNRFKAAVMGAGISDWISYSGTSSQEYFAPRYFGGPFWDKLALYQDRSPLFQASNINTPLLLIHGDQDKRVPISQSYELQATLKSQNKPVKMLRLNGQDHVPTNPAVIKESIHEINLWLKKALGAHKPE